MWQSLFPNLDPAWAWRRRMVFAGCATFLGGIINSIWFDRDIAHSSMVMTNCAAGFGATLLIYTGLGVTDAHLKRETDRKAQEGQQT